MKVIPLFQDLSGDPDIFNLGLNYYNDSTKQIVNSGAVGASYATELPMPTLANCVSVFTPKIIADATGKGYSITSADIIWYSPNVISPEEKAAIAASVSGSTSRTFAATVAGGAGNAVFYPTNTGLVGGTALFSSIDRVIVSFDLADPTVACAKPVVSNANKTITINCQKQTFNVISLLSTNILGSVSVGNAANGVVMTVTVIGTLA